MSDRQMIDFPPYQFDVDEERLWRDGAEIPLKPTAMRMLRYLATNPRRLVTRTELMAAVWEGSEVSAATLRSTLRQLRSALIPGPDGQEIIQTVHGRGYRFLGGPGGGTHAENKTAPERPQRLFGREPARHQLSQWLNAAFDGRRQVGFVVGEPGIGKTSLVQVFSHELEKRELLWGTGQCISQHGAREPYHPLLEALGRLCRRPGGRRVLEQLRIHAPTWLVELPGLLVPAERRRLETAIFRVNQERMLRELADAVESICAEEPMVLVLEDLHWSDGATLDAIEVLARRTEPAQLLVLATHRPVRSVGPDGLASRLETTRVELHLHGLCADISLESLSLDDVRGYFDARFPGLDAPDQVASEVFRRSEGNPLVMVSYADELVRRGRIVPDGSAAHIVHPLGDLEIPSGVRRMLEHQIDQLSRGEQNALEAASVSGAEFHVEGLARALAPIEPGLDDALTRVQRETTLLSRGGEDRLRFRHGLYQEILYERLSATRKKALHNCLGLAMERDGAPEAAVAAELSVHFERGGDLQKSVRYALVAAEAAIQRSAHQEATKVLRHAKALLDGLPDSPERRRMEFELLVALGNCLSVTEGYTAPEVHDVFRQARERLADADGKDPRLISVLSGLCGFYTLRADHETAYEIAIQQRDVAERTSDPYDRLVAGVSVSSVCYALGRLGEAVDVLEAALGQYDLGAMPPEGRPAVNDVGVHALAQSGFALATTGRLDEARRRFEQARERAREIGHAPSELLALYYTMIVNLGIDEYDEAHRASAHCLELSMTCGFPFYIPPAMIVSGATQVRRGQPTEGLTAIEQAVALLDGAGARLGKPLFLSLWAGASGAAGDLAGGLQRVREGLHLSKETGERPGEPELHCAHGDLLLAAGETQEAEHLEAEACYQRGVDAAREMRAYLSALRPAIQLARLWGRTGQGDRARALLGEALSCVEDSAGAPLTREARTLHASLGSSPPRSASDLGE